MSQAQNLLDLFRMHGNRLTLAFLTSEAIKYQIGVKYSNRLSDLRKRGFKIDCEQNSAHPGDNLYTLYETAEHFEIPTLRKIEAVPMNLPFGDMR